MPGVASAVRAARGRPGRRRGEREFSKAVLQYPIPNSSIENGSGASRRESTVVRRAWRSVAPGGAPSDASGRHYVAAECKRGACSCETCAAYPL
ncbi:hypothetical protein PSAC2689_90232 [Paraburkholderia sacchari]